MDLRKEYEDVISRYLSRFCSIYYYDEQDIDIYWVGGEIGGTVEIGDFFISADDIRYCIDNNVPKEVWQEYYGYTLRLSAISDELPNCNLKSWHRNCPRISLERLEQLEEISDLLNNMIYQTKKEAF